MDPQANNHKPASASASDSHSASLLPTGLVYIMCTAVQLGRVDGSRSYRLGPPSASQSSFGFQLKTMCESCTVLLYYTT
ncbi:hypothetical protein HanPSC8_Chr12g0531861 [Helianthus annuus]|nr:hypothetical protein HanPSC8_Chr12g0531861 [Helianthus annuus]